MNHPLIHPNAQPLWNDHRNARALASRDSGPEPDPQQELEGLIRDAITETDEHLSNCCHARFIGETDFCSECKEHAAALLNFVDGEYEADVLYDKDNGNILQIWDRV